MILVILQYIYTLLSSSRRDKDDKVLNSPPTSFQHSMLPNLENSYERIVIFGHLYVHPCILTVVVAIKEN